MKRMFFKFGSYALVLASLVMATSLTSCNGDNTTDADEIAASPNSFLAISADGIEATFNVTSNASWSVTNVPAWASTNPTSGANNLPITLTVTENETEDERSGTIEFTTTNGATATVSLRQAGLVPTEVPAAAGTIDGLQSSDSPIVLTVEKIEGATTYAWYFDTIADDNLLQNTSSRTYTATTSGRYIVAGMNSLGRGTASSIEITITSDFSIEDIAGNYGVQGYLQPNQANTSPVEVAWDTTIEVLDATTIRINNYWSIEDPDTGEIDGLPLVGVYNPTSEMLVFRAQKTNDFYILGEDEEGTIETYFAPWHDQYDNICENIDKSTQDIRVVHDENGNVSFTMNSSNWYMEVEEVPQYIGFWLMGVLNGECVGASYLDMGFQLGKKLFDRSPAVQAGPTENLTPFNGNFTPNKALLQNMNLKRVNAMSRASKL